MSSLSDLPIELLDHIFAHLDSAPPSQRDFNSLPVFRQISPTEQPLKNISLVSHCFRTAVVNRLFTHLQVKAGDIRKPLRFISQASLSSKIESILIKVLPYFSANVSVQPQWWCQLFDHIPAARIIVQCQPEAYDDLFKLNINLNDSWAFKVPCQYIEFGQSQELSQRVAACDPATGFFAAKRWQSLRINEGSSLAAYTSYEYFLKKQPSLLASLEQSFVQSTQGPEQLAGCGYVLAGSPSVLLATAEMFANLREFSYTSVFPFYNHVDEVLKCIKRMNNLQRLFIKLCPEPGSTILEDAVQAAMGHIDLNDPWSEVNIAYTLIAHALFTMGSEGPIESFTSGDVGVAGIRDNLVDDISTKLVDNWTFDGHQMWTKQSIKDRVEAG